jgi:hypothetical protein
LIPKNPFDEEPRHGSVRAPFWHSQQPPIFISTTIESGKKDRHQ